jgi:hypothetical protein
MLALMPDGNPFGLSEFVATAGLAEANSVRRAIAALPEGKFVVWSRRLTNRKLQVFICRSPL